MENILNRGEAPTLALTKYGDIAAQPTALIPTEHLAVALANAALDPDGQVYPWLPGYPLVGGTVVWGGQLWTVVWRERGPDEGRPTAIVRLEGEGHDASARATLSELRPVTWTALDEIVLEIARADLREAA